jgi:hypothetical protein
MASQKTKPSDFTNYPYSSVEQNTEREIIACNIMKILSRTGNTWRELTLEEYITERNKDSTKYNQVEKELFLCMKYWCKSAEEAKKFSKEWN